MLSRAAVLRVTTGLMAGLLLGFVLKTYVAPLSGSRLSGNLTTTTAGMDPTCMNWMQSCNAYILTFVGNDYVPVTRWCTGTVTECWQYILDNSFCDDLRSRYVSSYNTSTMCMIMGGVGTTTMPGGPSAGTAQFFDAMMMPSAWQSCMKDPPSGSMYGTTLGTLKSDFLLNNTCSAPTQSECSSNYNGKWLANDNTPSMTTFSECPYSDERSDVSFASQACCYLNGTPVCGDYKKEFCSEGTCPTNQTCKSNGTSCGCAWECGTIDDLNYNACCTAGQNVTACCAYNPTMAGCALPKNYGCNATTGACELKGNNAGTYTTNTCDDQCVIPCGKKAGDACGGANEDMCCSDDPAVELECGDAVQKKCTTIDRYVCDVTTGNCVQNNDPGIPDSYTDKAQCDENCSPLCCSPNRTCDVIVPGENMPPAN